LLGPQIGDAAARLAQTLAGEVKLRADGKIVYDKGGVKVEGATITVAPAVAYNPNGAHIAGLIRAWCYMVQHDDLVSESIPKPLL
jgi:hypothetical protein